ncbi:unnamed protein product [Mesocestoides corti]|uniref:Trans-sialidase n=1 Tax=Mesocestoides corti TaxID=53468 RepID=A0A0R3U3I6_MESCO|nr:unnamed protein product [Mesocestoides corti]
MEQHRKGLGVGQCMEDVCEKKRNRASNAALCTLICASGHCSHWMRSLKISTNDGIWVSFYNNTAVTLQALHPTQDYTHSVVKLSAQLLVFGGLRCKHDWQEACTITGAFRRKLSHHKVAQRGQTLAL